MEAKEIYSIRNVISVEEIRSIYLHRLLREHFHAGIDDPELFYTTDPSGFFVGELDGKPISTISLVKYEAQFAFVGMYTVDKPYRGKGYGLALFRHAMASLSPTHNCGLDAPLDKVSIYEGSGFKSAFFNQKIQFDVAHCASLLLKFITPANVVRPAKEVDQDLLSEYDTTAFGAPHHLYLKTLLETPNSINLAATDSRGDVIGFVSARKAIAAESNGWNIGPLFADDGQIARALLRETFTRCAKESQERKVAVMSVPVDLNPEAKALADELGGRNRMDLIRMFTKGTDHVIWKQKIFSFVGAGVG